MTQLNQERQWDGNLDLGISACHACGRDRMVACWDTLHPQAHRRAHVRLCRECLIEGVSLIDSDEKGAPMAEPARTYDFPWGTRPICPRTHEATIGGDGYGDRCCGTADVETVEEADAHCPRGLCTSCCDDTCCHACHAKDVTDDEATCRDCQQEMAMTQADLDREECRVGLCHHQTCGRD